MRYVAHAAVQLYNDYSEYKKDEWYSIKHLGEIEYRWRLKKDLTYEWIAGVFDNRNEALKCAKRMYVTLLYTLLRSEIGIKETIGDCILAHPYWPEWDGDREEYLEKEGYFFWDKKTMGGILGPGVYEVEESIDEASQRHSWGGHISLIGQELGFNVEHVVDKYYFLYSIETQDYLQAVLLADRIADRGMSMTLYCGLLEHFTEDEDKEQIFQEEIDQLIAHVNASQLSKSQKESLKGYLHLGKKVSSRQKCRDLCEKYAKEKYGGIPTSKILNDAYSLRSSFTHDLNLSVNDDDYGSSYYIKHVVLDVIYGLMQEKEKEDGIEKSKY